jgi:hypothetical protein
MIVCGQCGERNEDGAQFCGACGEFLEWAGQPNDRVPETSPPTTAPVATIPTTTTIAPPPPTTLPPPPHPTTLPPPSTTTVPPPTTPVGDPNAPRLVRPDEQVRRPRVPVTPPEQRRLPMPGEKICGNCGAGNEPTRRFCNVCGHSLADAPVAAKLPWWRRFLRRIFGRKVYNAGERRDVRQPVRWQRPTFILTLLALLIIAFAVPPGRTLLAQAITAVQDRFGKRVPVVPVAGRATSSTVGHGATLAFDGANNTYWAPAGNPLGEGLTFDLPEPVRLLNVIITGGVSTDKTAFLAQGRPAKVDATVTDRAGKKSTTTFTMQDAPGGQRFSVAMSNAVQLTLIIRSDYGVPPGHLVAIAEVELFARG